MGRPRTAWSLTIRGIAVVAGVVLLLGSIATLTRLAPTVLDQFRGPERVEMADAGFAISLPRDWQHASSTVYDDDWWDPALGAPAQQHEEFVAEGGVLLARKPTRTAAGHQQCAVYRWSDLEAQVFVNTADDDPRVSMVESHRLELPGGDAVAFDRRADDAVWLDYLITDGQRWLLLECGSMRPPTDRWRFIADTIEFLPEEL